MPFRYGFEKSRGNCRVAYSISLQILIVIWNMPGSDNSAV